MRTARLVMFGACGLAALLMATGCGPGAKDLQIQALQEQVSDLHRENDDLRSRLALVTSERDGALSRAIAMQQQNRDLRDEIARLAAREPVERLPAGWQGSRGFAWIDVGTEFLFKQGYANLRPEGTAKLQDVVNQIKTSFPDKMIWVIGHTDSVWTGSKSHVYKDNLDLSLARGATVYRELKELGIDTARMVSGGQGEFNPKAPNDSAANMQINRRVQIMACPMPGASALDAAGYDSGRPMAGGPGLREK